MNSIRLIHIEKHARFHLRVSACVVIVIGDNLGKRFLAVGCNGTTVSSSESDIAEVRLPELFVRGR